MINESFAPVFERCTAAGMIAVVQLDDPAQAEPLAHALADGGIRAVELALRTPAALEALGRMKTARPDLMVGAGTVLNPEQAGEALAAGAAFAVAPGLDAATVRHCAKIGLPFAPGVSTASEIQGALALGCRLLKFFPAEFLGGIRALRALHAPFAHLGPRYIALGAIAREQAAEYLGEPFVAAVGGSWIAPAERIRRGEWALIRESAAAAAGLARSRRGGAGPR